ncbi:DUF2141 domain-containing protein [Sphingomonas sp. TREG-RG-20F-R18-01]|uniref:DUF2141 domain-containing protein n=1 Tax=Sphingomonas sp. TREG-RG-20F-R18-01 TaxID=2914982 RepID=UPI001F58D8DF|nr:DUF2141 domain-containing protein [Sphingomonas sp. TREG-RG-20F-R18-01]
MVRKLVMTTGLAAAMLAAGPARAVQSPIGSDSAACTSGGPAIRVTVDGLKDRTGELKLELYPANAADFLKDDRDLIKEGKFFRRVRVPTPASGPVVLCIRVPSPGPYALLFTHNRDGRNKFNFWSDGAGFPSNTKLGRARPKVTQGRIVVPEGVVSVEIRAQYLRGLGGFGPIQGG